MSLFLTTYNFIVNPKFFNQIQRSAIYFFKRYFKFTHNVTYLKADYQKRFKRFSLIFSLKKQTIEILFLSDLCFQQERASKLASFY